MANAVNSKDRKHSGGGSSSSRHAHRVVRVNKRLVLITLGVSLLLLAGTYIVHGFQVERHADTFLARADAAEKDGDIGQAIGFLAHYYQFRPDDTEALLRLGRLRQQTAADYRQWSGVFFTFEEVLRRNPSHPEAAEIRRDLVDVAMKIGEFDEARVHLELLLKADPDDAGLLYLLGRCWHAERRFERAARLYLQAIDGAASVTEHYLPLAGLLAREFESLPRREDLEDLKVSAKTKALIPSREEAGAVDAANAADAAADVVLARMVEECRPPHEAYLARARYRQGREQLAQARQDVEAARETIPDSPDLLLQSASLALAESDDARLKGDPEQRDQHLAIARQDAEAGLAQDEDDLRFYLILSQLERQAAAGEEDETHQLDRLITAENYLEQGLARVPALREAKEQSAAELTNSWIRLSWSLADLMLSRAELARAGDEKSSEAGRQGTTAKREDAKNSKRRQDPEAIFTNVAVLIGELDQQGASRALVDFLSARMHMVKREWSAASRLLEQSRRRLPSDSDDIERIDLMLGACYAAMGNPDQQINVYDRALNRNPRWLPGRLGLAAAYVKANRLDDGLREYNLVSGVPGVAAEVARILLMKELAKPSDRRWDHILKALDVAEKVSPDSVDVLILRAQVQALQGRVEEAVKRLESGREQHADSPEFWAARAALELQREDRDAPTRYQAAKGILEEGRLKVGDCVALRSAEASAILTLPADEAHGELAQLAQDLGEFTPAERAELFQVLATAYAQVGDATQAESLWRKVATLRPTDVAPQLVLAELAFRADDDKALEASLARIRQVEGPDGPNGNYIEAKTIQKRLFADEALHSDPKEFDEDLDRPRDLLRRVMRDRPYWPAAAQALGELEYAQAIVEAGAGRQGELGQDGLEELLAPRLEKAAEYFEKAFELGDRSTTTVERLVTYYRGTDQLDRADALLRQVSEQAPKLLTGQLARLAADVAWQRRQFDEAIGLAADVADKSQDYADQVYLARLRFANGERGEAVEGPLKEAAYDLAPDKAGPWLALVEYYVRTDDRSAAEAVIGDAAKHLGSEPPFYRPLTLGRCYEAVGDRQRAESQYVEAMETEPGNAGLRAALVEFYIRGADQESLRKADQHIGQLLQADMNPSVVQWARRRRAVILASHGVYEDSVKALDLLKEKSDGGEVSVTDLRTRAAILARMGAHRDRQELIETLEELVVRKAIRPAEQRQLARLYSRTGRWDQAIETLRALVEDQPTDAALLGDYASALLNRPEFDDARSTEAEVTVGRLEALEPGSFRAAKVRALLDYRRGDGPTAAAVLRKYIAQLQTAPPEKTFGDYLAEHGLGQALSDLADHGKRHGDEETRQTLSEVRQAVSDGQHANAVAAFRRYVQTSDFAELIQAQLIHDAAGLLEQFQEHAAAEAAFRQYVERSPRPEAAMSLATFLGRRGDFDRGLEICEGAQETCLPEAIAVTAVNVVSVGRPTGAHLGRAETLVETSLAESPGSPRIRTALAGLRVLQSRGQEAETLYRLLLQENPRNVAVLNNLAFLLAGGRGGTEEAGRLIDEAIALAGPLPALLDTRAVVHLAARRTDLALADLREIDAAEPSAMCSFRLALAQLQAGDEAAAKAGFHAALRDGLTLDHLHPLEHENYQTLARRFPPPST